MKSKLRVKWSQEDNDLMCFYPEKCDGFYIFDNVFNKKIQQELIRRKYDIKTLNFSIERKKQ